MRIQNCIMTKKQIIQISMLSVHGIILLCSIINIVRCILQHKLLVFPLSYGFFNIPLYRYISSGRVIDFFALIAFIIISVVFTILECKEIIKGKTSIFIFSNGLFVCSCFIFYCCVSLFELEWFYRTPHQLILDISVQLLGMCALAVIAVIQSASIVKNRTEEDLEKSKYINKNKLIIIFIGLFVFVLITEYFMYYNEFFRDSNIPRGLFQGINIIIFFKNLAYVLGIYLGVGSILQSVKRICKLKKANFLNGNEQIAMFRNDRNKKIIALAVFILSYFVFYLFK